MKCPTLKKSEIKNLWYGSKPSVFALKWASPASYIYLASPSLLYHRDPTLHYPALKPLRLRNPKWRGKKWVKIWCCQGRWKGCDNFLLKVLSNGLAWPKEWKLTNITYLVYHLNQISYLHVYTLTMHRNDWETMLKSKKIISNSIARWKKSNYSNRAG